MKTYRLSIKPSCLWVLLISTLSSQLSTFAQGTAFTYQGRLTSGANPANGNYDFRFNLYQDDGSVIPPTPALTSPITATNLGVTNGLFTVALNFGANFPGADRWLEILVRTNGGGAFTTFSPRQKLTPTPYAITAGNVTAGGGLSGTYSNAVTLNNAVNAFTGNGAGLIALNAANITSGTLLDARLSGNVALRDANQTFSGANNFLGNVGIGTTTPGTALELRNLSAAGPSLRLTGVGGPGSKVGIDLATYDPVANGTTNVPARIEASDNNWSAGIDFQTKVPGDKTNALVSRLFIQNSGNVGIGTNNPQSALHVAGMVTADNFLSSAAGVEPPSGITPILNMIWIVPGTFVMGSPTNEVGRSADEGPQTVVTLTKGFWMGHHPVTQGEYESLMNTNPSYFTGNLSLPVETVSWNDATNFCGTLTQRELTAGRLPGGWVYRLPTEAEWEYACRALTTTRFYYGDDPTYSSLTNYAWWGCVGGGNSGCTTHPVGQKLANPWGLVDMHGNIQNWCQDWYGTYPGGSVVDPQGAGTGTFRVIRNFSWANPNYAQRSAQRSGTTPTFAYNQIGLRVVLARGQP